MLIVTRSAAIPVLNRVVVAPVTRSVRRIPSHLPLGPDEGLKDECAASFDNVQLIPKALLTHRVGEIGPGRRDEFCTAVRGLADC